MRLARSIRIGAVEGPLLDVRYSGRAVPLAHMSRPGRAVGEGHFHVMHKLRLLSRWVRLMYCTASFGEPWLEDGYTDELPEGD